MIAFQMSRYSRGLDEESSDAATSGAAAMQFPADITQGFVNPNSLASPSSPQREPSLTSPPSVFFSKASKVTFGGQRSRDRKLNILAKLSTLEKILIGVSFALLVCVIALLSAIVGDVKGREVNWVTVTTGNASHPELCVTGSCVRAAAAIVEAMDANSDPCDDFYNYACSGWAKFNPLPDGKSVWGSFNKLWQQNQLIMKNVLESESFKSNSSAAEQKARVYYASCLDKNETIERLGAEPMIDFLKDVSCLSKQMLRDPDYCTVSVRRVQ